MPHPPLRRNPLAQARARPQSRARALRAYYWEMAGCGLNQGCADAPLREMRREADDNFRRRVILTAPSNHPLHISGEPGRGHAAVVKATCAWCAGEHRPGHSEPANAPRLVRGCAITDCPLWRVRPWQNAQGRGRHARKPDAAVLEPVES